MVNTTFLVYLSQTKPEILQKLETSTISSVAVEVERILDKTEARELLLNVKIVNTEKAKLAGDDGKWLSQTDVDLLRTAKTKGMMLVSDDKKIIATAQKNHISIKDTPHFIESQPGKISKQEALEFINQITSIYVRRKILKQINERIKRW